MFIQNAVLKSINAEGLSFPLAEGSVVSVGGVTGIVPTTLNVRPATNRIYVAVAGTIDLTSDANKGVTFTEEQIKALGGDFNFVPALESPAEIPAYSSTQNGKFLGVSSGKLTWAKELPAVSGSDNGKVLTVSSGTWSAQTPSAGGLPSVTTSDNGKFLTVYAGEWVKRYIPACVWGLEYNNGWGVVNVSLDIEFYDFAQAISECKSAVGYVSVDISSDSYYVQALDLSYYSDGFGNEHVVARVILPISGSSATLLIIDTYFDYDSTYEYVNTVTTKTIALT
ncbi:MAG: hypothetical protein IJK86_03885 [Lachnospiraceae bacterium]|nr:hypothetical protein [Clostridia bacterium]MBQ6075275.1 hypothetical protein [Lachnospiraceae bacterium]MBQ6232814.1 hypothetical protein [Clostridia bacterium]